MSGYLRPVDPINGRICTYYTHTHRTTPSSEAGVDYYCPIGTPIRAAGNGTVFEIGGGIQPATGRYITIDLDDGRRVRYLHLSRWAVFKGRVTRGQIIGYSGASGYGSEYFGATSPNTIPANTGGPHVHTTLWAGHYYQFGRYPIEPTLDFERYVGGSTAGGSATPFIDYALLRRQKEDVMYVQGKTDTSSVYAVFSDATGRPAMRLCGKGEAAYARGAGIVASGDDGTLTMLSQECGYDVTSKTTNSAGRISDLIWGRQIDRVSGKVSALQDLADTGTIARQIAGMPAPTATVDIDEAAVAAALAPILTANLKGLSDEDIERLAKASADELTKRLAS